MGLKYSSSMDPTRATVISERYLGVSHKFSKG